MSKRVTRVLAACFGSTTHLQTGYNGAVLFWDSKQVHAAKELPDGVEHILMSVRGVPEGRANWFRKEAGRRPMPVVVEELDSVNDLERRLGEIFDGSSVATVAHMSTSSSELFRRVGLVQSMVGSILETMEIIGRELTEIRTAAEMVHSEQSETAVRIQMFERDLELANGVKELLARHQKAN